MNLHIEQPHLGSVCVVPVNAEDATLLAELLMHLTLLRRNILYGAISELPKKWPQQLLAQVDIRVAGGKPHDEGATALRAESIGVTSAEQLAQARANMQGAWSSEQLAQACKARGTDLLALLFEQVFLVNRIRAVD